MAKQNKLIIALTIACSVLGGMAYSANDNCLNHVPISKKNYGQKKMMECLQTTNGINDKNSSGHTVLHYLTKPDMVKVALIKGANVNARSNFNQTPLHALFFMGSLGCPEKNLYSKDIWDSASILMTAGANLNAQDNSRNTPLHYVKDIAMFEALTKAGARTDVLNLDGQTAIQSHNTTVDFVKGGRRDCN